MHSIDIALLTIGFSAYNAFATYSEDGGVAVTNNVLELTTSQYAPHLIPPSSKHLARRRSNVDSKQALRRQNSPLAAGQEDLIGLGGRIYIANVTLAGKPYALVLDTGSSDTWIAHSSFQCESPLSLFPISLQNCGFGALYDSNTSPTFQPINYDFEVNYTGGEFLYGRMGIEKFGIGGVSRGKAPYLTVRQTIGVVNEGYWIGDGISSGLMGMGFPALARGINTRELNYTSVIFTLFQTPNIQPIFSLALRRPTVKEPRAGGLLAIGGIPDIPHDGRWVQVPIEPVVKRIYAWYSIIIDGFDIAPPLSTTWSSTRLRNATKPSLSPKPKKNSKRQFLKDYSKTRTNMIIDSGTTLLYFPDHIAAYIASLFIPPARYSIATNTYIISCNALPPRVGIIVGGRSFYIHEDDLMNRGPGAVGGPSNGGSLGTCVLAVQRAQGGSFVLGDTWLKNVLVAFDVGNGTDFGIGASDRDGNGGGSVRIVGRENY